MQQGIESETKYIQIDIFFWGGALGMCLFTLPLHSRIEKYYTAGFRIYLSAIS